MDKNKIANILLSAKKFLVEKDTWIDNILYPCQPLYFEYINLYPDILSALSIEISSYLKDKEFDIMLAMEAAILPLATLVANQLSIPLAVVRKPNYVGHEKNEPLIFIDEENIKAKMNAIFFDDAIWSGKSVKHVLKLLELQYDTNFHMNFLFIIDFTNFFCENQSGTCSHQEQKRISALSESNHAEHELVTLTNMESILSYDELISIAYEQSVVSFKCYDNTLKLMKKSSYAI